MSVFCAFPSHFVACFARFFGLKLLILQNKNNNKKTVTENTNFYNQFCCWQIKIFHKDRLCLLK